MRPTGPSPAPLCGGAHAGYAAAGSPPTMPKPTRFSRRHLLALATFLVPLLVLAVLGWLELRRGGELAQAALEREARQFLASARQAVEQQLDLQVQPAFAASQRLLVEHGPIRTTIRLREQEGLAAVDDLVLLDEQAGLVWPPLPPFAVSLPLLRDPQRGADNAMRSSLAAAELLLTHGRWQEAIARLRELIDTLEAANPPGRSRRLELEETEVHARFRLAAALRRTGDLAGARGEYAQVATLADAFPTDFRIEADMPAFGLLAAAALAELGTAQDRLDLLTDIATNRYDRVADGLAGALVDRLAATFAPDDPRHDDVERLLAEDRQRTSTRAYGATYELVIKYGLRLRRGRRASPADGETLALADERLVATLGEDSSLLAVRPASDEERRQWQCSHVGIHFDLDRLLAPALQPFVRTDGNFVLAVFDQDVQLVDPPEVVPKDFIPPSVETNGLTLRAYPADASRMIAEAHAAATTQAVLLLALVVTALGGALWSWRSASREAELAALKIDLVSRVSHELKTPLALIRMYGETLGMGRARDPGEAAGFGSIIARESERLTMLIQRILDFSRQQAGTLGYASEPHDLGALLRSIAAMYAPHLEAKGALLVDDLPPDITVRCDANAAESAIVNLLENATKYGPDDVEEHEIELVLRRGDGVAIVEVRDRGRGIPEDELERVFEGFYRASNAGEVRGAGLGLGLVRHFARAHGGEIEALRRPGGGTIMRLTLPLADRKPPADGATHRDPT